jgi:hypothetical protein
MDEGSALLDAIVARMGANVDTVPDLTPAQTAQLLRPSAETVANAHAVDLAFAQRLVNYFYFDNDYYKQLVQVAQESRKDPAALALKYANNSFFASLSIISTALTGFTGNETTSAQEFRDMVADALPQVDWLQYRSEVVLDMIKLDVALSERVEKYTLPQLQQFVRSSSQHRVVDATFHILSALLGVQFVLIDLDAYTNQYRYNPVRFTGTRSAKMVVIERKQITTKVNKRATLLPFYVPTFLAFEQIKLPVFDKSMLPRDIYIEMFPPGTTGPIVQYQNPFITTSRKKRRA